MSKQQLQLSRRKLLAGVGTAGVATAAAGLGTTAYLNDTESFTGNQLTAGELDLLVHWFTDVDQGFATPANDTQSGTVNGKDSEYSYTVTDVKPGDSGTLGFCPEIIDNDAYLWIGSENGVTDFENGQNEPEAAVDPTGGDPGEGNGELSENMQVTVSLASSISIENGGVVCDTIRELNNPDDYTLADLSDDLMNGFLIEDPDTPGVTGSDTAFPAQSDEGGTPCLCIEWVVPTTVGNVIQSDSVELDFRFEAVQARHNPNPQSPFNQTNQTSP